MNSLLRAAQAESGGVMGVTAVHVESGRRISLNRGERFPMASVFKVAAAAVLERVAGGESRLGTAAVERAIARAARVAYDDFVQAAAKGGR